MVGRSGFNLTTHTILIQVSHGVNYGIALIITEKIDIAIFDLLLAYQCQYVIVEVLLSLPIKRRSELPLR